MKRRSVEVAIVGYIGKESKPTPFVASLMQQAYEREIKVIYFTLAELDLKNEVVRGGFSNEEKENIKESFEIPRFIDVDPILFNRAKNRSIFKELQTLVTLSTTVRFPLPRSRYPRYFKPSSYFYERIIFRKKVESIESLAEYLEKYESILITPPRNNSDLRAVILQRKKDGKVAIHPYSTSTASEVVDLNQLYTSIDPLGCYIEKFIFSAKGSFKQTGGYAHFEKGEKGEWILVRASLDNGECLKEFYEKNFPDNASVLYEEEIEVLFHLARVIEKIRKRTFTTLAIYFVVDEVGTLHIGKVTQRPPIKGIEEKVATLRVAYYEFKVAELYQPKEIEEELAREREHNQKIERELIQFQEEEEHRRELIEKGLLKEERAKWTTSGILVILALIFLVLRYVMRVFL